MTQPNVPNLSNRVVVRGRKPRVPMSEIDQQFLLFVTLWAAAKDAGRDRDKVNKLIKAWFSNGGDPNHEVTVNDNGSQSVLFPEPKEIAGRKVLGLENRRTVTSEIDPDLIDEYLEGLPTAEREALAKQLFKPVTEYVLDMDALFRLQQEGELSEDTVDGFYETSEKWALCVLEALS